MENLEQIFQCYKTIQDNDNLQVRRDFYIALTLMLIPNLEEFLKCIVNETEHKDLSLEILNLTLTNIKDTHLTLFMNKLCDTLINGDINAKMKIFEQACEFI